MSSIIEIQNLSKHYALGQASRGTLREVLSGFNKSKNEVFKALDDVSFDVEKGQSVGIIGSNGAGKSTLLKVLSKITKPTSGRVTLEGRVTSLLEVGTGFHPELTGRENIFLNGSILGMNKQEIRLKFDAIVAFSGVEKFLDTPVKHYSSGMYVRLAFAVAAHLESEILIVDEVLAVGDAEFQKKCLGMMKNSEQSGRTVLFVSHSFAAIRQLCSKGIWLDQGQMKYKGEISKCIDAYSKSFQSNHTSEGIKDNEIELGEIFAINSKNQSLKSFSNSEEIQLIVNLKINSQQIPDTGQFRFIDSSGQVVFISNHSDRETINLSKNWNCLKMIIPAYLLNEGVYNIYMGIGFHTVRWVVREFKVFDLEIHFSPMNLKLAASTKRAGAFAPMLHWECDDQIRREVDYE